MFVILTFFLDGSGIPDIKFIPQGDNQNMELVQYLTNDAEYKQVVVYFIDNLVEQPKNLSHTGGV